MDTWYTQLFSLQELMDHKLDQWLNKFNRDLTLADYMFLENLERLSDKLVLAVVMVHKDGENGQGQNS